MAHSLQSNPVYHQTSGDSGRPFCGAAAVGAVLAPDSFRFLLYFPVRLYFPLVPEDARQKVVVRRGSKLVFLTLGWFRGWDR